MRSAMILCIFLAAPTAATAQETRSEAQAAALADALAQCRTVTADTERLACFDRASAELLAARKAGDVLILDRDGMRQAKRRVFGFQLPRLGLFGDRDGDDRSEPEVREIEGTIARVSSAGHGLFNLTLADGSQWQTLEGRTGFLPKAEQSIRIEAGMLGSYNAKVNKSPRVLKVKRIR